MTTLIMIRHGETEWNLLGRLQGHRDSPLTEVGLAQATAVAKRLRCAHLDAIYSSDLERARHTARHLGEARSQVIHSHEGLREKTQGELDGLTRDEIAACHPEAFRAFQQPDHHWTPPGGESYAAFTKRCMITLEDLRRRHPEQTLALVTHGGFIAAVFRHVLNLDMTHRRRFKVLNASLNSFVFSDGNWHLETWGDVSHLSHLHSLDDVSLASSG